MGSRGWTGVRPLLVVITLLLAAGVLLPTGAAGTASASSTERDGSAVAIEAPLVIAGIGGLTWADVDPDRTPALWSLFEPGAYAAATTVFTNGQPVCPSGGWLSLSAARAAPGLRFARSCVDVPHPDRSGGPATIPGWTDIAEAQERTTYRPRIGTLGDTLEAAGTCATAVGPGAAVALATSAGTVERYADRMGGDVFGCPLTMIDLGDTSVLDSVGTGRIAADVALGDLLALLPRESTLLVTSVSAPIGSRLAMGVTVVPTGSAESGTLSSSSTRWPGVVRLLDLPSTIMAALDLAEPNEFSGSPLAARSTSGSVEARVDELAAITTADRALRPVSGSFLSVLALVEVLLLVGWWWIGRRTRADRSAGATLRARRLLIAGATIAAALPLAAYLVALVPGWRTTGSVPILWGGIAVLALLVGGGAAAYDWRRPAGPVWRPAVAVSALTLGALVVDVLLGTPLHRGSPLGPTALTGGRYYGFGNNTYAIFAVHLFVVLAAVLAVVLRRRGRTAAVVATLAVSGAGLLLLVWPTLGADIGGGLALAPALAILAIVVSGTRLTWRKLVLSGLASVLAIGAISVADWTRGPANRSHAGRFVQSVVDGDAWETVTRKAGFAASTVLRGPAPVITLLVVVLVAVVLARPQHAPRLVRETWRRWPTSHIASVTLLIALGLGAVVNDYGVRVVTIGLLAAAPLVAATMLRTRLELADPHRPTSDRSAPRSKTSTTAATTAVADAAAPRPPATETTNDVSAKSRPT